MQLADVQLIHVQSIYKTGFTEVVQVKYSAEEDMRSIPPELLVTSPNHYTAPLSCHLRRVSKALLFKT